MTRSVLLPEWAPVRAVLLAWPYPGGDWQASLAQVQDCYFQMLKAITTYTDAWILQHPSLDTAEFLRQCHENGIEPARMRLLPREYDDTWIRDYGPLSMSDGYITFRFNGWGGKYSSSRDDLIAQTLPGLTVSSMDLVCEGGALETNGETFLLNADCVVDDLRNPGMDRYAMSSVLAQILGADDIEWLQNVTLTGDDTDGHIDTLARFARPDVVVYSGPNPEHPDAKILERLHRQISQIGQKRGWKTLALPSPVVYSRIDQRQLPATYANFLFINEAVLIPVYGVAEDEQALDILSAAMPDKILVPVRCEALLEQHGSLHCATMQVADGLNDTAENSL